MPFNRRHIQGRSRNRAGAFNTSDHSTRCPCGRSAEIRSSQSRFHRFMLGEFKITVILDGMRTFDGPHPTFGADRDAGKVQSLMEANFLPWIG
jgi:hypothetical protein